MEAVGAGGDSDVGLCFDGEQRRQKRVDNGGAGGVVAVGDREAATASRRRLAAAVAVDKEHGHDAVGDGE